MKSHVYCSRKYQVGDLIYTTVAKALKSYLYYSGKFQEISSIVVSGNVREILPYPTS